MAFFPDYIGPSAFGIKMGVVVPGTNLVKLVVDAMQLCHQDKILEDGDVICVTESVVARSQNNFVSLDEVAEEVRSQLSLTPSSKVGVVFPIASRNRFSMVLEGIARAVPQGEVVVQLSWPTDEVGNYIISDDFAQELNKNIYDTISSEELAGKKFAHPITKVDYIQLYRQIIESQGAKATLFLANDPQVIAEHNCDGIIASDIHSRVQTKAAIERKNRNTITLTQLCSDPTKAAWTEWGLLGSNMSADDM